jgi:hypothetical protein
MLNICGRCRLCCSVLLNILFYMPRCFSNLLLVCVRLYCFILVCRLVTVGFMFVYFHVLSFGITLLHNFVICVMIFRYS